MCSTMMVNFSIKGITVLSRAFENHFRLTKLGVDSTLVEWTGAIHAQVAFSAQFAPAELDPAATRQVGAFIKDLRFMVNKGE